MSNKFLHRLLLFLSFLAVFAGSSFAKLNLITGSYTGNGANNRVFSDLGFAPDVLIIKSENTTRAWIKTSTMSGNMAIAMYEANSAAYDRILSLNADGFTIGNHNDVNGTGKVYHYVAMQEKPGVLELFSYIGDASLNRQISTGFEPAFVVVIPENNKKVHHRSSCSGARLESYTFGEALPVNQMIQEFNPDGFKVGDNNHVNQDGNTYHVLAIAENGNDIAHGCFTGNGNPDRLISGLGFEPHFVLIRNIDTVFQAVQRVGTLNTNESLFFTPTGITSDRINYMDLDGVNIGDREEVNRASVSYYYLAMYGLGALPIELFSFSGEELQHSVRLNWVTASEINNDYFTVERSADTENWEIVTEVKGAGTSSLKQFYTAFDENPLQGNSYYRLKQSDYNGTYSYSGIISINYQTEIPMSLFPNPATDLVELRMNGHFENADIVVRNKLGQVVIKQKIRSNHEKINLHRLGKGVYFMEVIQDSKPLQSERLLVY